MRITLDFSLEPSKQEERVGEIFKTVERKKKKTQSKFYCQ